MLFYLIGRLVESLVSGSIFMAVLNRRMILRTIICWIHVGLFMVDSDSDFKLNVYIGKYNMLCVKIYY